MGRERGGGGAPPLKTERRAWVAGLYDRYTLSLYRYALMVHMTTHRPRVRSTLIRALIITVVAAAIVVAYRTWDYVEARRLERQLAAIEGGGESLTRYNLSRPLRLPESADNAERYYVAAAELLESSQFGPALKAMAALRRSEPAPAPDAAQWAVVREWIHSNTLALDLLATAARHEWGPGSPHRVGESGYAPVFGFVRLAELVAAPGFDLARSGSAEPAAAVLVNGWRMMRRGQDPFFSTWSAMLSRSLVLGVQSVLGSERRPTRPCVGSRRRSSG